MDTDVAGVEQCTRVLMDYCLRHCAGRPPSYTFRSGGDGDYVCQVTMPKASPVICTGAGSSASKKMAKEIAAFGVVQRLVSDGFVDLKSTAGPKPPIQSRKRTAQDIGRAEEVAPDKSCPREPQGLRSAASQNEHDHRLQETWKTEFTPLPQQRAVGGNAETGVESRPSSERKGSSLNRVLDVLEISDNETSPTANYLEPVVNLDDESEEVIVLAEEKGGEVTTDGGTNGESNHGMETSLEPEVSTMELDAVDDWNRSQTTMDEDSEIEEEPEDPHAKLAFVSRTTLREESLKAERYFVDVDWRDGPMTPSESVKILQNFCFAYTSSEAPRYEFEVTRNNRVRCTLSMPDVFALKSLASPVSISKRVAKLSVSIRMYKLLTQLGYLGRSAQFKTQLPSGLMSKASQPSQTNADHEEDVYISSPSVLKWIEDPYHDDLALLRCRSWRLHVYMFNLLSTAMQEGETKDYLWYSNALLTRQPLENSQLVIVKLPTGERIVNLEPRGTIDLDLLQISRAREYSRRIFALASNTVLQSLVLRDVNWATPEYLLLPVEKDGSVLWDVVADLNRFKFSLEHGPTKTAPGCRDRLVSSLRKSVVLYRADEMMQPMVTGEVVRPRGESDEHFRKLRDSVAKTLLREGDESLLLEVRRPSPFEFSGKNDRLLYLRDELCVRVPIDAYSIHCVKQLVHLERFMGVNEAQSRLDPDSQLDIVHFSYALFPFINNMDPRHCYERHEFIGDSVLNMVSSTSIFKNNPNFSQAGFTFYRKEQVSNQNLCKMARAFHVEKALQYTTKSNKLRLWPTRFGSVLENQSMTKLAVKLLADCMEAITGLFFTLGKIPAVESFLNRIGIQTDFYGQFRVERLLDSNSALCADQERRLSIAEKALKYKFRNPALFMQAVTHRSIDSSTPYEKLEFLGDSLLNFMITNYIYEKFTDASPGTLTELAAVAKSNDFFAVISVSLRLHECLWYHSECVSQSLQAYVKCLDNQSHDAKMAAPKVLGDVLESIAAAIFLDSGGRLEEMWKVMRPHFLRFIRKAPKLAQSSTAQKHAFLTLKAGELNLRLKFKYEERSSLQGPKVMCSILLGGEVISLSSAPTKERATEIAIDSAREALTESNGHSLEDRSGSRRKSR
ncbi:hypothetical protein NDN08_003748 [Rhodosorus marinus]|uniref:RNase III domain-containing protein n=1 Tax=Rhodosorus marinus TaxID=101924 RepID=A0AAV8UHS9_9RHOD|nr:hypothetical protein NDN08_003748 [Rhodosorus marinus]